jgi:choline dehydrogenase-like flavoprotein
MQQTSPDIVIIGSGMGGATIAAGLAGSGARILMLERGQRIADTAETRDVRAIFQRGHYRPKEQWFDQHGAPFNPGNYYYVGGNTKLYGAVLIRYRREDFGELEHDGGVSPAWPFPYEELEPWYSKAEALYQVRGSLGEDPTEPPHSRPFPHPPVPDEAPIAQARAELKAQGLHPFSLPLGVDHSTWLKRAATPWDAYPDSFTGKMDAETCGLKAALSDPSITLETGAEVLRLETEADGKRIAAVLYKKDGAEHRLTPKLVILSAGAVMSAVLLLRSADSKNPKGLANRSDQIGRNFMNHNTSAVLAIDPRRRNNCVYQKTIGFNDFYLSDGKGGRPLGNVQLLGRVTAPILKANIAWAPEWALSILSGHAIDWYAMSEDLPNPDSRIRVDGDRIILDWQRSNLGPHKRLVAKMKAIFRAAGYPIVLDKPFDRKVVSHQCGTVRMGTDPARSALDPYCRAFDHGNLFVVDAGYLPNSAAVNPSLTVAAQALRVADHIRRQELRA